MSKDALFGWIGGKKMLRKQIAEYVPEQDLPISKRTINHYVEVFGGMAWMLLYKDRWFKSEVYNDYNGELFNLFNVVKFHPQEFRKQLKLLPESQQLFNYLLQNEPLTDVQKAVKCFVKYALSFSSKGETYAFRVPSKQNVLRKILELSNRLDKVAVSNMSYEEIIPRFNKPDVFLYLDPPYFGHENLYQVSFKPEDHNHLRDLLIDFKGKFALSYNDHPVIRELYQGYRIETLSTRYTAFHPDNNTRVSELLIMNY